MFLTPYARIEQGNNMAALIRKDIAIVHKLEDAVSGLRNTLESSGFSVTLLCSAVDELFAFLQTNTVALVLMELSRGENGEIQAAETIMNRWDIPVIFLVGTPDEEFMRKAQPIRPYGFIPDRIDDKILAANIEAILYFHTREQKLRWSESKYTNLYDSMIDGFIRTDSSGKIIECNASFLELVGYTAEELSRLSYFDLTPDRWHNKEFHVIQNEVLPLGFSGVYEKEYLRKDGSAVPVEIRTCLLKNGNDAVEGMWSIVRDISARKRAEEELLKANKLESIAVLAGGIAHDFNNILTAMLGNISLSKMMLDRTHSCYDLLNDAEKAGIRAKDLTQQLLTFSRGGAPVKKSTLLPSIIRDSADFVLRGSISKCLFSIPDELWPVHADEGQISQVIQNLVINADQAMPKGGVISITARNKVIKEGENPRLGSGRYVEITISDSGVGIPESFLPDIFDPYFTTKQTGSGLGLSICYSIIKNHAGIIDVKSEIAHGTAFTVTIPAAESVPDPVIGETSHGSLQGQGRLLIMDDDAMIRSFMNSLLTEFGYTVDFASDGEEALTLYEQAVAERKPYSLSIMDLTIPGRMGGKETIELLHRQHPSAVVVVTSGYSNDPVMDTPEKYGFSGVLAKPFTAEILLSLIKEMLLKENKGTVL